MVKHPDLAIAVFLPLPGCDCRAQNADACCYKIAAISRSRLLPLLPFAGRAIRGSGFASKFDVEAI